MSDFFEATRISDNEERYRTCLAYAFETARNADTVSPRSRRSINRNHTENPSAAHPASRLLWAATISDVLENQFCMGDLRHQPSLFFVTLIDRDWLTPVDSAVDLLQMKRKIRAMTAGRSYLFVIEPGYYANIQNQLFPNRKTSISWHVHGLMWDIGAGDMQALVDGVNCSAKYKTLIPRQKPAHAIVVKQGHLPRFVGYMVKPPANAYRVFCHRKQQKDRKRTLGIETPTIYVQRKQSLRPGEIVRLFHALKDIDPLDILIGGGDGRQLTRQIRLRLG
jgi:hypothetical protein